MSGLRGHKGESMKFLSSLLGCRHRHETWPMKPRNRGGMVLRSAPSYRVCLDCGREREYTLLDAQPLKLERTGIPQEQEA